MDVAVIGLRIVQFAAAAVLFGAPLFLLYGLRGRDRDAQAWARPLLAGASLALAAAAALALLAQTAAAAGEPAAALDRDTLTIVALETPFGLAILLRCGAAVAALALCLLLPSGGRLWTGLAVLGAAVLASFAWTGHGAATEGPGGAVHLAADILHLLAAGVWLGALAALAMMLRRRRSPQDAAATQTLHAALAGFSGVGSASVAVLLLTGLVNSWFLVGPYRVLELADSAYGTLLLIKLGLFVGMLGLAARNRFQLTPSLARSMERGDAGPALGELRRSIFLETAAGMAVLVLVAWLGTLSPPAAT